MSATTFNDQTCTFIGHETYEYNEKTNNTNVQKEEINNNSSSHLDIHLSAVTIITQQHAIKDALTKIN